MKDITELTLPANLRYAKDHEWVSAAAPFRVGVSDFAQDQLGDITFVELPKVGAVFKKGDEFGSLESIKSVSSVYLPIGGTVTTVNGKLADDPALVNQDPYGEGWLLEITPADPSQLEGLMKADAYLAMLKETN